MTDKKTKKEGAGDAPKKTKKKKKGGYLWSVLGVASLVFFAGIIYLSWSKPEENRPEVERRTSVPERREPEPVQPSQEPVKEVRPRIAIMIDDLGNSKRVDDDVLSIDAPLTVAVLPLLPESKRAAEIANSNGKEVVLHLPMEPHDYPKANPGKGALFTSMDDIAIVTQLYEDIRSVPGIKGVNNHMGSKFTEDRERMRIVLKQLKDKDLYFIDSKTSPRSQNEKTARELGIRTASRNVFLDNQQDEEYVTKQIEELKSIARSHGSAVGIGHPHPATLAAVIKSLPELEREFDIVPASEIVR